MPEDEVADPVDCGCLAVVDGYVVVEAVDGTCDARLGFLGC
jgi:hypothetical protein